jgi:hypothetical protein
MVPPAFPRKVTSMTTSPQTATLLPMTVPFTERLSETWLLERTFHAHLCSGKELSVRDLTLAMKQLIDFDVPLSTWREISQEEASAAYQQGIPILLYGEHSWRHQKGASLTWSLNRNMRVSISGNALEHAEAVSGTDYAVCYLDPQRGTFSNAVWRAWFASDSAMSLDSSAHSTITFLGPSVQFPYTTHYTVIAADGHVHEYADRAEAIQGFQTLPPQKVSSGSQVQTVFPQFCYYHEVTCPSGVYRLEFFGPRMDERGYQVKEAA